MPGLLTKLLKGLALVTGGVIAALSLLLLMLLWPVAVRHDAPPGVTGGHIRQVRPGMSVAQVVRVLGRPYHLFSNTGNAGHIPGCPNPEQGLYSDSVTATLDVAAWVRRVTADSAVHRCDLQAGDKPGRSTTFLYSRAPQDWTGSYPMLWVQFDARSRVVSTYAMLYKPHRWLSEADEGDVIENAECIYSLSAGKSSSRNIDKLGSKFD